MKRAWMAIVCLLAAGCAAPFSNAAERGDDGQAGASTAGPDGGEAGGPAATGPVLACPHGALRLSNLGPVSLDSIALSWTAPWEPHPSSPPNGATTVVAENLRLDGMLVPSIGESSIVDQGDAEMVVSISDFRTGPQPVEVTPDQTITTELVRVTFGVEGSQPEAVDAISCAVMINGAVVASWP